MKTLAAIALALLFSSCSPITAPTQTLDTALANWDWEHRTEDQFWTLHPEFWEEYQARLDAYDP